MWELLTILVVIAGVRAWSAADGFGSVTGTLVAVGGPAKVRIDCGSHSKEVTTDAAGRFSIDGLPAGTCTLRATARGRKPLVMRVTVTANSASSIRLAMTTDGKDLAKPAPNDKHQDAKAEPMSAADRADGPPPPPPAAAPLAARERRAPMSPSMIAQGQAQQPLVVDDQGHNTEGYSRIDDNPFRRVASAPLSTFSVDVDTASYSNTRRFLAGGTLPPKDAVRIEELVNYFTYAYPRPTKGDPFSITTEVTTSPWNAKHQLVRIGLAAPAIDDRAVPARNLVFLLDVSGSMNDPRKLPLLQQSMNLLVEQLRPQDRIAIVTYAGNAGLVLPSTSGSEKDLIKNAIFRLEPGGSTNGAAGIQLAYHVADRAKVKGGINRVILATDGDFNVGTTSEGDLTRLIELERGKGVFLTVLGFGMGNLKDSTMEKLADRGNGNYAYIDSLAEARKVLVTEAGATLVTVAKDVKLQIEMNPALVAGYRLIGYENRLLRDEDFNDDTKDAGEIGAGHSVTALYEIVPAGVEVPGAKVDALKYQSKGAGTVAAGTSGEMMTVKIRYKAPDGHASKLLSRPVAATATPLDKASIDTRWAAAIASFGMMLRESTHRGNLTWKQVEVMAKGALGTDTGGYRAQALQLISRASTLHR